MNKPHVLRHDELFDAEQTPGMTRKTAFDEPGIWIGTAQTEPGAVSGWHHHGDNTTYLYCLSGAIRLESGPGGEDVVDARPGDFMLIPQTSSTGSAIRLNMTHRSC